MAAIDVFIEEHRIAQLLKPCRRLAGMARMDAVVLGRGMNEDLGVGLARTQVLIRRILLNPGALLGDVRVAVLDRKSVV